MKKNFVEELRWRGMLAQMMPVNRGTAPERNGDSLPVVLTLRLTLCISDICVVS